ncbi:hypothetical protein D3C85_1743800 [compost metagenome]
MPSVRNKLLQFRSERFTPEETFDHITQFILESESVLANPILGKSYTEISGDYKGLSRIVIKRFRVYFEQDRDKIVIVAVMFPGEK